MVDVAVVVVVVSSFSLCLPIAVVALQYTIPSIYCIHAANDEVKLVTTSFFFLLYSCPAAATGTV